MCLLRKMTKHAEPGCEVDYLIYATQLGGTGRVHGDTSGCP
jgi:hypothetical protein